MSTSTALVLYVMDGEPRVLDTDLASRLGMAQPLNIRSQMIVTNRAEMESYGPIFTRAVKTPGKVGRPATACYLNEEQALLLVMFSRTTKAAEVRREIITVYQAWRHGQAARPEPLALPQSYREALLALADEVGKREAAEGKVRYSQRC